MNFIYHFKTDFHIVTFDVAKHFLHFSKAKGNHFENSNDLSVTAVQENQFYIDLLKILHYYFNEFFQKLKLDRPLSEQKTMTISPKVEFPQALAFASLKNFKIPKVIIFSFSK